MKILFEPAYNVLVFREVTYPSFFCGEFVIYFIFQYKINKTEKLGDVYTIHISVFKHVNP